MRLTSLTLTLFAALAAMPRTQTGTLQVTHDAQGIPHIEATTDAAAMFGVGWAAARDRWFQMCVTRLTMDGRLAQYFGAGTNNGFINNDISARLIGWRRRAEAVATLLPTAERDLLQAYADGVNHYVQNATQLHPLFATSGVPSNTPWTVADCILAWYRIAKEFAGDGLDEIGRRDKLLAAGLQSPPLPGQQAAAIQALFPFQYRDDATAALRQTDFTPAQITAMQNYATTKGVSTVIPGLGAYVPTFSDALAVGASRTADGVAALWGAPRVPVYFPNMGYEWRMKGSTFDARGLGFPGSPILLVGATKTTAWTCTSMGIDQADLFRLTLTGSGYLLDGQTAPFALTATERILVKNGQTQTVQYRLTAYGPIVKDDANGTYAVTRVPLLGDPSSNPVAVDTFTAALAMYRATDQQAYTDALRDWTFPSANMVFALSNGKVGYAAIGAIPVRTNGAAFAGLVPLDGSVSTNAWQEFLPHSLRPLAVRESTAVVFSANHLAIGTWYPMSAYIPGLGDTERSYRLRRIIEQKGTDLFTERNLDDLFRDAVRENGLGLHELGEHVRSQLSGNAVVALDMLGAWITATGGAMQGGPGQNYAGVAVASHVTRRLFAQPATVHPAHQEYGVGFAALNTLVRELRRKIVLALPFDSDEVTTIANILSNAHAGAVATYGNDSSTWGTQYDAAVRTLTIAEWDARSQGGSLTGGSLMPAPQVVSADVDTLADQAGALYNQLVLVDGTGLHGRANLAVGQSELPGNAHQVDQVPVWATGNLRAAPLATPAAAPTFTHIYP